MAILYLYRIYSTTEPQYQYIWSTTTPTVSNTGGPIDANQTSIVNQTTISDTASSISFTDSPYTASSNGGTITANTTSGVIVINLPDATLVTGKVFNIVNSVGSNNISIVPFGSQTIDGSSPYTLSPSRSITIQSDGSNWTSNTSNISVSKGVAGPGTSIATSVPVFVDTSGQTLSGTSVTIDANNNLFIPSSNYISKTSNQLILGTTNTTTINATAPSASRIYTIPDSSANSSFVLTDGAQTLNSVKTFSSGIPITATTNQIVLGTTNTTTISSTAPSASRIYTIPDSGTNTSFIMGAGNQTVAGVKTFSSGVPITATTNQLVLGTTLTTTISSTAPSASRIYTLTDTGANSSFIMSDSAQTMNGVKTFTSGIPITATTNQFILGTTNTITVTAPAPSAPRTYTIPDSAANSSFVLTDGAQTLNGIKTHTSQIPITATSNQLVLGTTTTTTLSAVAPSASRTYQIPDSGANSSFVLTDGAQTLNGTKTFSSSIPITSTTNQIVLGTTNTTTINSNAPSASRIYTIPDTGANSNFVMTDLAQTVNGVKTFTSGVPVTATTNQIILGSTNTITLTAPAPSASRTYTIPDTTTNSSFIMTDLAQTLNGVKTFTSGVPITTTTNQIILGSTNTTTLSASAPSASRTYTIIDSGANSSFIMSDGTQTLNGVKTFTSGVPITATTNQIIFGSGNTTTLTIPAPSASRVYTVPDTVANSSFVMTDLAQTINSVKTFTSGVVINSASNQLTLGSGNQLVLTVASLASGRTYTLPEVGTNSSFVMTDGAQTINNSKSFTSSVLITPTSNQLILGTTNTTTVTTSGNVSGNISLTLPMRIATLRSEDNNVIRVEKGGNNTNGSRGGAPFLTLTAALSATGITSGDVIIVGPGVYSGETFPLVIPTGVTIVGNEQLNCVISATGVTANTTVFNMGLSTSINNLSIVITSSTASLVLKGVVFPSTSTNSAKISNCMINISNTISGAGGTITAIESSGTGVPPFTSFMNLSNVTALVSATTATSGTARGLLLNAANTMNTMHCAFTCNGGAGISAYAAETSNASAVLNFRSSLADGTTGNTLQTSGSLYFENDQLTFANQQTANTTSGETLTAGAYRVRTLNTKIGTGTWASLASNVITLQPGTYTIRAYVQTQVLGNTNISSRVNNTTDTIDYTTTSRCPTTNMVDKGNIEFTVTYASAKTLQLESRVSLATTAQTASSYDVETYSYVTILRTNF